MELAEGTVSEEPDRYQYLIGYLIERILMFSSWAQNMNIHPNAA
jgi:hypothetical protein